MKFDGKSSETGDKGTAPKIPSDKKLSARHHRESIKFNAKHAKDHAKEAKKHQKALKKMGHRTSLKTIFGGR